MQFEFQHIHSISYHRKEITGNGGRRWRLDKEQVSSADTVQQGGNLNLNHTVHRLLAGNAAYAPTSFHSWTNRA
jgi:hypothetical protein